MALLPWYMGNSGMIYAVNANEDFNAIVEYIGMYMLFFSAPLYSSYETTRPGVKRYLRTAGTLLCLVFFSCLILYLLPTGYTFVYHLRIAQGVQIVMVFFSLLSLLFPASWNSFVSFLQRILRKISRDFSAGLPRRHFQNGFYLSWF